MPRSYSQNALRRTTTHFRFITGEDRKVTSALELKKKKERKVCSWFIIVVTMSNSPISASKLDYLLQTLVCKEKEIIDNVFTAFKGRGNNLKKNPSKCKKKIHAFFFLAYFLCKINNSFITSFVTKSKVSLVFLSFSKKMGIFSFFRKICKKILFFLTKIVHEHYCYYCLMHFFYFID